MVLYGGYRVDVIAQAMLAASLHLASGNVGNPQVYVDRTMDDAMPQALTDDTVLGWEG
jgi:hypothetical protein